MKRMSLLCNASSRCDPGSSRRRICGWWTKARMRFTRSRCPAESSQTGASSYSVNSKYSRSSLYQSVSIGAPKISEKIRIFSHTFICSKKSASTKAYPNILKRFFSKSVSGIVPIFIVPELGAMMPPRSFRNVVFPLHDGQEMRIFFH